MGEFLCFLFILSRYDLRYGFRILFTVYLSFILKLDYDQLFMFVESIT